MNLTLKYNVSEYFALTILKCCIRLSYYSYQQRFSCLSPLSTIRLSRWKRNGCWCRCRWRNPHTTTPTATTTQTPIRYPSTTATRSITDQEWCIIFHSRFEYITDTCFALVGDHIPSGYNGSVFRTDVGCEGCHSSIEFWMATMSKALRWLFWHIEFATLC